MAHLKKSKSVIESQPIKRNAGVKSRPKPLSNANPPVFNADLDALARHLNGTSIASLSMSRIAALAKRTSQRIRSNHAGRCAQIGGQDETAAMLSLRCRRITFPHLENFDSARIRAK